MTDQLVYMVRFPEVGVVKIGHTVNLQARLTQLNSWLGYQDPYTGQQRHAVGQLIMRIDGGTPQLERALHYRYRKQRCYLREGFREVWVLPTLDALDPHQVMEAYLDRPDEEPAFDEDVTEVFPPGFRRVEVPGYAIDRMVQDYRQHRRAVRLLEWG